MKRRLLTVLLVIPQVLFAQTAYLTLTSEPCYATKAPAAKFVFKASVAAQKVLYTAENFSTKEINSFAESNCTVVDKDNWNCDKSFATNGMAYRKDKLDDSLHYCHFSKKTFGDWELLKTKNESQTEAKQYDLMKKIERLLMVSLTAEIFKQGVCVQNVKKFNPSFYAKTHYADNANWLKSKYSNNKEVVETINSNALALFAEKNWDSAEQYVASELGIQPTPAQCGVLNGKLDKQISTAKSDL
jgi:hypothetical protein